MNFRTICGICGGVTHARLIGPYIHKRLGIVVCGTCRWADGTDVVDVLEWIDNVVQPTAWTRTRLLGGLSRDEDTYIFTSIFSEYSR